jgi:hypothetical protein
MDADVIIVGAGPVGLMLAGERGQDRPPKHPGNSSVSSSPTSSRCAASEP